MLKKRKRVRNVCLNRTVLLAAELKRAATATPPASSDAFTILLPLESLAKLFLSIAFEADRFADAIVAAEFVLITTDMVLPCFG